MSRSRCVSWRKMSSRAFRPVKGSGAAAQAWLLANVPYFANTPSNGQSAGCGASTAQIPFALTVRPSGPTCSITTVSPLPTGTINVPYSTAIATSDCTAPITFSVSAGALPGGVTLDTVTGVISGTASLSDVYAFTVSATDSVPNSALAAPYILALNNGTTLVIDGRVQIQGVVTTKP